MKRLISGVEAVRAGIFPCLVDYGRGTDGRRWIHRVPAVEPTPNRDAYLLWRSRDGYRKACRMLRRSGRRIHTAAGRRFLRKRAEDLAAAFPATSYVSPDNSLLRALTAQKEP